MTSRSRRPRAMHLYDSEFTPGHAGGKSLFNGNDVPPPPESPLSQHVREFDMMLNNNKAKNRAKPSPLTYTGHNNNNNSYNYNGGLNHSVLSNNNSPDTPRTLAFRKKIGSLSSACRSAVANSSQGRSPRGHRTGLDFAFGDSTPRLPTSDQNQHGIHQPVLWSHQKSQETNNEAIDNTNSQHQRKTSLYSGNKNGRIGINTGGSDRWKMTPIQHNVPPAPSQRNRKQNVDNTQQRRQQQQQQQQQQFVAASTSSWDSGLAGLDDDASNFGPGGPEIKIINDGMNLHGTDGDPFSQYEGGTTLYDPATVHNNIRDMGSLRRTGANILGPNEQRKLQQHTQNVQREITNVQKLPDQAKTLHPPLACRADLESHRQSNVNVKSRGNNKTNGKGPRIRRKNPGKKKELPSYMRPTAAMKQWTKQTADVKKQPKSVRKKQIY